MDRPRATSIIVPSLQVLNNGVCSLPKPQQHSTLYNIAEHHSQMPKKHCWKSKRARPRCGLSSGLSKCELNHYQTQQSDGGGRRQLLNNPHATNTWLPLRWRIKSLTFTTTSIDNIYLFVSLLCYIYSYVVVERWSTVQYHWQWMMSDNIMVVCIVHLCWCIRDPFREL